MHCIMSKSAALHIIYVFNIGSYMYVHIIFIHDICTRTFTYCKQNMKTLCIHTWESTSLYVCWPVYEVFACVAYCTYCTVKSCVKKGVPYKVSTKSSARHIYGSILLQRVYSKACLHKLLANFRITIFWGKMYLLLLTNLYLKSFYKTNLIQKITFKKPKHYCSANLFL
jgi:hypothetical protein